MIVNHVFSTLCIAENDCTVVGSYIAVLHRVHKLKVVLDAMVPMKYLLDGEELKNFFLEMKWLTVDAKNDGDEGLQRFNEEYDTLLNVLKSYDTKDELLIVDSLKPVVRLFSSLQRFCNCTTVQDLISILINDNDMQTDLPVSATVQNDGSDLTDRIPAIKDLFQSVCQPSPPSTVTAMSSQPVNTGSPDSNSYSEYIVVKSLETYNTDD